MIHKIFFTITFLILSQTALVHALGLTVHPEEFDFGWSPRNAKIDADFKIINEGESLIPLTSVEPACGCTAAQFSPENLASQAETKVTLTFNTRGYDGASFRKPSKIKSDDPGSELTVFLKGHVLNSKSPLFPMGDGVAAFISGGKTKKVIRIQNNSQKEMTIRPVHSAAGWAKTALSSDKIDVFGVLDLTIEVDSIPKKGQKTTSVTYEAVAGTKTHRFTVAIRAGTEQVKRRIKPPPK